jgi:hypothetical protein
MVPETGISRGPPQGFRVKRLTDCRLCADALGAAWAHILLGSLLILLASARSFLRFRAIHPGSVFLICCLPASAVLQIAGFLEMHRRHDSRMTIHELLHG